MKSIPFPFPWEDTTIFPALCISSSEVLLVGQRVPLKRLHLTHVNSVPFSRQIWSANEALMKIKQKVGYQGCPFCSPQGPCLVHLSLLFPWFLSDCFRQVGPAVDDWARFWSPGRRLGEESAKVECLSYNVGLAERHIFEQWLSIMDLQQHPRSWPRHEYQVLKHWSVAAVAKSTACGGIMFQVVIQFGSLGRYHSLPCLEHDLMMI